MEEELKKLTENSKEFFKFKKFVNENREALRNIIGLDMQMLAEQLEIALKLNGGFYRSKDENIVIHVKGIEIYPNAPGDLKRCGFNGESNGVFLHVCTVVNKKDEKSISQTAITPYQINYLLNSKTYRKATEEEYKAAYNDVVKATGEGYSEPYDAKTYLKIAKKYNKYISKL